MSNPDEAIEAATKAMAEISWILDDYADGDIREVRALGRISRVLGEYQENSK